MPRRDKRKKKFEEKTLPEKKLEFRRHLRTYLVMSVFFFVLSVVTGGGWWIWPVMGWGIGVALQGLSIYGPLADPEDAHPTEEEELEPLPDLRNQPEKQTLDRRTYRDEDLV